MRDATYNFSSSHIDLPPALSEKIISWGKDNIKDDDLFVIPGESHFGREDEAHVTVLYGIHDKFPNNFTSAVKGYGSIKVYLDCIDVLPKEKYDVMVINVSSPNLELLHHMLTLNTEYTNNYKRFIPHITLGYVKKDCGWKHFANKEFYGETFVADYIVFSSVDGTKHKISLL
jgi:hypothetical protein